jgi:hypothetical protein
LAHSTIIYLVIIFFMFFFSSLLSPLEHIISKIQCYIIPINTISKYNLWVPPLPSSIFSLIVICGYTKVRNHRSHCATYAWIKDQILIVQHWGKMIMYWTFLNKELMFMFVQLDKYLQDKPQCCTINIWSLIQAYVAQCERWFRTFVYPQITIKEKNIKNIITRYIIVLCANI